MAQQSTSPDRDASLGLIFRLNNLWAKVDYVSVVGKYVGWNNLLDALYRNLLFKEDMVTNVDEKTGKITRVRLSEKDVEVYRTLSIEIAKAREKYRMARFKVDKAKARSVWYHAVQNKDIWLRKFMQKLKLYLKETEQRQGSETFGTFGTSGRKKR